MSTSTYEACMLSNTGWPEGVRLYHPDEKKSISLPDFASTLAVKTFLNMTQLHYEPHIQSNSEFMSDTGKLPVVKLGEMAVCGFEAVVYQASLRGHSLTGRLSDKEKADMQAFMSLVETYLWKAEAYLAWNVEQVASEITKQRYASSYSWPLNELLPWLKQRSVKRDLHSVGWRDKSLTEVCSLLSQCCTALSEQLGQKQYLCGAEPTELDALVFGHLFAIVTTALPNTCLADIVQEYDSLQSFLMRVNERFFENSLENANSPKHLHVKDES